MAPQNVTTIRSNSKSVPSSGMRGGLGRTLLTAFLVLSIAPLSLISFVAATQARGNLQSELREKLATVAVLTESQLNTWVADQQQVLGTIAASLALAAQYDETAHLPDESIRSLDSGSSNPAQHPTTTASANESLVARFFAQLATTQSDSPAFIALLLVDKDGNTVGSYPSLLGSGAWTDLLRHRQVLLDADTQVIRDIAASTGHSAPPALLLTQSVNQTDLTLVALLNPENLAQMVDTSFWKSQYSEIYLVPASGGPLKLGLVDADIDSTGPSAGSDQTAQHRSAGMEAALSGQSDVGNYENYRGEPVIGAYRWLPHLNAALLVEQAQDSALAASDGLAVVLIGTTLAMVLVTALIAAGVTRRITLPIVELTATAVQIASGDLNQRVPAARHDEIGILARAFNVMTTKLRLLYEDLEQKVKERTQQLEEANAEIRYQAMQLAISAEVGRVVTSILDREILPAKVVDLIRDCFQAYYVAIYFVDSDGRSAVLQEATGGLGAQLKGDTYRVDLGQYSLVSQAISSMETQMVAGRFLDRHIDRQFFPHTCAELAIPLKIGPRIIGVLDVHSTHADAFDGNETMVLETLSGQVAVAIENSRVYEIERRAAEQLREFEKLRRSFLSNMSRELRMPLNNIIGFSRVILKGIDGPITDLQHEDLQAIHDSGQQLLVLINDILDIAHIEAGEMELSIQPVDFGGLAHSIIPTVNALLQGRPVRFDYDISPDLPPVLADPHRLRQVLVKLLSNAASFTHEGEIQLRVWSDTQHILASVTDTGIGIPEKDREKAFEMFQQLSHPKESNSRGTGLGLTFSKEIVEMHGGRIWLESDEGKGTTFTFTLPITNGNDRYCHSLVGKGKTDYGDHDSN